MSQPICRRCLLKDLSQEDYFKNVYEYIEHLPAHVRTPEPEYSERLAVCQACDCLVNGMCRLCGCFVETRAAKRQHHCAKTPENW